MSDVPVHPAEEAERPAMEADEAPRRGRLLFLLPLLAFAGLAGIFLGKLLTTGYDPSAVPSALIGRPVPDFVLPPVPGLTTDGAAVPGLAAADFKGKVTVLNVWASWCAPCQVEHPMLVRLARDGVNLVGIDYKDQPENGRRFLGRHGNPFRAVGADETGRVGIDLGVAHARGAQFLAMVERGAKQLVPPGQHLAEVA